MMKKNHNNKGVTLIEILIGIIITSIMVGAMYTSYNVVSGAYKQVSDKAKISSSSRDLITMIMRDIRMAGFKYYSGNTCKGTISFKKLQLLVDARSHIA